MADSDEETFHIIDVRFPPDPAPCDKVNGKVTCDLTGYDAPPTCPENICQCLELQVLKLFIDNFRHIPKGLGNLVNLEHLVLCRCESEITQETPLTNIPKTLKNLKKLTVLDLRNNHLQMFPDPLTQLVNLEELHISNCQLSFLPDSLAHLKKLKTLDISSNLFTHIPNCVTKLVSLSKLYLSDGRLQSVDNNIKNLVNLERLQLTNNEISSLPEGLFELVTLKKLYLNTNKLTSLHEKLGNLVNLEYLVLNQNKLTKIPDSIKNLKELRYLNLHENMLSRLPECITDLEQIETILIDNNPLHVPPIHVCTQGIQSIRNYFKAMKNTRNIHSKRLKVVVVGESMAGKTSLVNALMNGESTKIDEDDRTFGVVFHHWKPEPEVDELELMVVDCAGQKKYQMTHQLFLSEGALFVLAVDLSLHQFECPESYQSNIGQWISLVAARIPRARILIAPTHIDKCLNAEDIDLKCRDILNSVNAQRQGMVDAIENEKKFVKRSKAHCIPTDDLEKLMEEYREQKDDLPVLSLHYKDINDNPNVCEDQVMHVIPISNTELHGILALRKELVRIARNRSLSPNIDINLPESWVNIEKEITKHRKSLGIPCLSISELQELLSKQNIDVSESELRSCVSYLAAIGELQYFKGIAELVKNVVINPYWLGSVLKKIFRHDMVSSLTYNDCARKMYVVPFLFEQYKEELLNNGIMSQPLLKCLWSEFLDESNTIFPQLLAMFTHFGLVREMPTVNANALETSDGAHPDVYYLVPWFFKQDRPESLVKNWPLRADDGQLEVTVGYALLQYLPFGVFERFSVLCHKHAPDDYEHWQSGFYMQFGDVFIYSSVLMCVEKCETLTVTARAPRRQLGAIWRTLLRLLKEVEKLLKEWPGMHAVPFTVCPQCVREEVERPQRFTCNWFEVPPRSKSNAVCRSESRHSVPLRHLFPSKAVLEGYRKPVESPYPDEMEIPDCILSNDLFDGIAEMLGTRWPRLARQLHLSSRVDSIKNDERDNTHEQAVAMLTEWKQRVAGEARVKTVIEALRELKFNEIADFILRRCRPVENSGTHATEA